jgi:small-conductance mechanosensitive channel
VSFLANVDGRITRTVIAVAVSAVLSLAFRLYARRRRDHATRAFVVKTFDYVLCLLTIAVIVKFWWSAINLGTLLGLSAAGLVLSLKDLVVNFAGWLFILMRSPLSVGDRVQVGTGVAGDVVDIRLFMFSVLEIGNWIQGDQATGRVVHVPNGVVFREPIANYSRPLRHIWNELAVDISYESDWRRAQEILQGILERHAAKPDEGIVEQADEEEHRYQRFMHELEPRVWLSVTPYSVRLSLRYLCDPWERRTSAMAIWRDVLEAMENEPKIALAYPTQRFYDEAVEGRGPKTA